MMRRQTLLVQKSLLQTTLPQHRWLCANNRVRCKQRFLLQDARLRQLDVSSLCSYGCGGSIEGSDGLHKKYMYNKLFPPRSQGDNTRMWKA